AKSERASVPPAPRGGSDLAANLISSEYHCAAQNRLHTIAQQRRSQCHRAAAGAIDKISSGYRLYIAQPPASTRRKVRCATRSLRNVATDPDSFSGLPSTGPRRRVTPALFFGAPRLASATGAGKAAAGWRCASPPKIPFLRRPDARPRPFARRKAQNGRTPQRWSLSGHLRNQICPLRDETAAKSSPTAGPQWKSGESPGPRQSRCPHRSNTGSTGRDTEKAAALGGQGTPRTG